MAILKLKNENGEYEEIPALTGASVVSASVSAEGHLLLRLSNGREIDAGKLPTITAEVPVPTWQELPYNASAVTYPTDGSGCVYAKDGNVVSVQGSIKLITALANNVTVTIGTLPEGYRPKRSIADARMLGGALFRMAIDTTGAITITNFNTSALSNSYNLQINIEFIAGN